MAKSDTILNLLPNKLRGDDMNNTCDICGRTVQELRNLNSDYAEINEKDSGLNKCKKCDREEQAGLNSENEKVGTPDKAVQGWKPDQSYY